MSRDRHADLRSQITGTSLLAGFSRQAGAGVCQQAGASSSLPAFGLPGPEYALVVSGRKRCELIAGAKILHFGDRIVFTNKDSASAERAYCVVVSVDRFPTLELALAEERLWQCQPNEPSLAAYRLRCSPLSEQLYGVAVVRFVSDVSLSRIDDLLRRQEEQFAIDAPASAALPELPGAETLRALRDRAARLLAGCEARLAAAGPAGKPQLANLESAASLFSYFIAALS